MTNENLSIPIDSVQIDTHRMHRVEVTTESVRELAASLSRLGQLTPILVSQRGDDFELIAGHRRLRAAGLLGWSHIHAEIIPTTPASAWQIRAAENLERTNLSPYEEALVISDAVTSEELELDQVATRLGRSTDWCRDRLAILDWPATLQQALHADQISLAAARPLAAIPDPGDQTWLIDQAIAAGVTARTTSAWLQECKGRQSARAEGEEPCPATEILDSPPVFKQPCYLCSAELPAHELTRLSLCRPCATALAQQLHPPPTPN